MRLRIGQRRLRRRKRIRTRRRWWIRIRIVSGDKQAPLHGRQHSKEPLLMKPRRPPSIIPALSKPSGKRLHQVHERYQ